MNNIADSLRCIIVYPASSHSQQRQPLSASQAAEAGSEDRPRLLRRGRGGSPDLRRQRGQRGEREQGMFKVAPGPGLAGGGGRGMRETGPARRGLLT